MAAATCTPPTTVGVAGGKVQVASGVRGLGEFAARADFQACFDAKLLKACDPRLDNSACTAVLADGVTTCQAVPQSRPGMSASCAQWKNLGYTDPATSSVWPTPDINWTVAPATSTCTWVRQSSGTPTPSPAQACVEDASEAQLAAAGTSGGARTQFPATRMMGNAAYSSPVVGDNLPKRMSRTPVFFDATQPWAPLYLARAFYAMHKRWGGQAAVPCCTGDESKEPACAVGSGPFGLQPQCGNTFQTVCPQPGKGVWWNGGVRKENIYFAQRTAGDAAAAASGTTEQVLCLRYQGDLAVAKLNGTAAELASPNAGIPALGRGVALGQSDAAAWAAAYPDGSTYDFDGGKVSCEVCKTYVTDSAGAQRVGAVLTSAENYGGGLFEVFARVPPANDYEQGGIGAVWAMWTFAYSETYPSGSTAAGGVNLPSRVAASSSGSSGSSGSSSSGGWQQDPLGQQLPGNLSTTIEEEHLEAQGMNIFSCGLTSHNCDKSSNWCPPGPDGKPSCTLNSGPYTIWNQEIDIEIPGNAARLPRADLNQAVAGTSVGAAGPPLPGWFSDTWNANTWAGDNQSYTDPESYRNVSLRRMDGRSFIATAVNDFHWYGFVWCTGSDRESELVAPYVDFYFDRARIHRITNIFIPSRAGKLNLGPWFGWWGGTPNFGAREVWIKYINIVPFAAVNDPWLCTPDAGAPQTAVPCVADDSLDVAQLAAKWQSPDGGTTPPEVVTTAGYTRLPHLTAAQLSQLYTTVAATQRALGLQPFRPPLALDPCDVAACTNDVTGPQMFDSCGGSTLRNVCDFNQFLVDGDDGTLTQAAVPSGSIPSGLVLGAIEPRGKCARRTRAMWFSASAADGVATTPWLNPTVQRWQYYDITVDPQPPSAFRARPSFPQTQFEPGQPAQQALIVGDPATRTFCPGATFCTDPPSPPPPSRPLSLSLARTAQRTWHGACATARDMPQGMRWTLLVLLLLLVLAVVGAVVWRRHRVAPPAS